MKIAMVSAEAHPFARTGGLGDAVSSLAHALAAAGCEVSVILPYWPAGLTESPPEIVGPPLSTRFSLDPPSFHFRETRAAGGVRFLLIDQPAYFDRPGLYGHSAGPYADNAARFTFFGRAVLELIRNRFPDGLDLLHLHDWHASLIPAQARFAREPIPSLRRAGSVLTIHNAAFQGRFPAHEWPFTGLPIELFTPEGIEFWGDWSTLKSGILSTDAVTTVSPTYATELLRPESGMGMDGVLRQRASRFVGIVNGVDPKQWDPASDGCLPSRYSIESASEGKRDNKRACQELFGLPPRADIPLVGMVGRLAHQKGIDILSSLAKHWLNRDIQLVVLGQGEAPLEGLVRQLADCYPDRVGVRIGFDDPLARQVYAGSDWFFMPSRYEPCGLSQLYAMRYGSIPIVHAVGGLADTVVDATPRALEIRSATGFVFRELSEASVMGAFARAAEAYRHPITWRSLVRSAMSADWSWSRSVGQYEQVYQRAQRSAWASQEFVHSNQTEERDAPAH
jgi:starch synthase